MDCLHALTGIVGTLGLCVAVAVAIPAVVDWIVRL